MNRVVTAAVISCVSIAAGGCRDAGSDVLWTGRVDTLASGTVVVSNPSTPIWPRGGEWRIHEVLRLGDLDGEGPTVFGNIGHIEVDHAGRMYIFDTQANELRVFEDDGRHLWTIGRSGDGPGEYQAVIGMRFSPDGSLWLVDAVNARYAAIRNDGSIDSFRRSVAMYTLPWLGGFDENGRFYDQATEVSGGTHVDVVLEIGDEGEPQERSRLARVDLPVPRAGTLEFPVPFAPRVLRAWDVRGPSIWQAVSSEYRIAKFRIDGDTLIVVTREFERRSLAAAQRDSVETYMRNLDAHFGVDVPRESRPSQISPLRWFVVDDQFYLWVCATGLDACTELDTFDDRGRFLGTAALPAAISDMPRPLIRQGYFYAVIEGEFGEPQLLKGRVDRR